MLDQELDLSDGFGKVVAIADPFVNRNRQIDRVANGRGKPSDMTIGILDGAMVTKRRWFPFVQMMKRCVYFQAAQIEIKMLVCIGSASTTNRGSQPW